MNKLSTRKEAGIGSLFRKIDVGSLFGTPRLSSAERAANAVSGAGRKMQDLYYDLITARAKSKLAPKYMNEMAEQAYPDVIKGKIRSLDDLERMITQGKRDEVNKAIMAGGGLVGGGFAVPEIIDQLKGGRAKLATTKDAIVRLWGNRVLKDSMGQFLSNADWNNMRWYQKLINNMGLPQAKWKADRGVSRTISKLKDTFQGPNPAATARAKARALADLSTRGGQPVPDRPFVRPIGDPVQRLADSYRSGASLSDSIENLVNSRAGQWTRRRGGQAGRWAGRGISEGASNLWENISDPIARARNKYQRTLLKSLREGDIEQYADATRRLKGVDLSTGGASDDILQGLDDAASQRMLEEASRQARNRALMWGGGMAGGGILASNLLNSGGDARNAYLLGQTEGMQRVASVRPKLATAGPKVQGATHPSAGQHFSNGIQQYLENIDPIETEVKGKAQGRFEDNVRTFDDISRRAGLPVANRSKGAKLATTPVVPPKNSQIEEVVDGKGKKAPENDKAPEKAQEADQLYGAEVEEPSENEFGTPSVEIPKLSTKQAMPALAAIPGAIVGSIGAGNIAMGAAGLGGLIVLKNILNQKMEEKAMERAFSKALAKQSDLSEPKLATWTQPVTDFFGGVADFASANAPKPINFRMLRKNMRPKSPSGGTNGTPAQTNFSETLGGRPIKGANPVKAAKLAAKGKRNTSKSSGKASSGNKKAPAGPRLSSLPRAHTPSTHDFRHGKPQNTPESKPKVEQPRPWTSGISDAVQSVGNLGSIAGSASRLSTLFNNLVPERTYSPPNYLANNPGIDRDLISALIPRLSTTRTLGHKLRSALNSGAFEDAGREMAEEEFLARGNFNPLYAQR